MAKKMTVAVIGIGRFGFSICDELTKLGANVIAIDKDEKAINLVEGLVAHSIICDSTNENNLIKIGIDSVDHVIVGIGQNVENSIMTTLILKDMGIKNISVKVDNDYHAKVVERIGATEVIKPEEVIGKKTARMLIFQDINDYLELSKGFGVFEIETTPKIIDINLIELNVRETHSINISAVRRDGNIFIPSATDVFKKDDVLIIIGENRKVIKFMEYIK